MSSPLLLIKAADGFIVYETTPGTTGDLTAIFDPTKAHCFAELAGTYSYTNEGAFGFIRKHFAEGPKEGS